MALIPIDLIDVGPRQRKKVEAKPLDELKDSILNVGLLHPIVVTQLDGGRYRLVAGGRRLAAIKALIEDGETGRKGQVDLTDHLVRATVLKEEDELRLLTMEYDENLIRVDLSWQEQAAALDQIHQLRVAANPRHTQHETAQEIHKKLGEAVPFKTVRGKVDRALAVASVMHRPDIAGAKSMNDAYQLYLKRRHESFEAKLAERRLVKVKEVERLWDLRQGDARDLLVEMPDNEVDLILVDPPYGLDVSKWNYAKGKTHRYNDAEEYARDLGIFILQEGWRLTKPSANIFMFCSWKSFPFFFDQAKMFGWSPWPAGPLVWYKATNEGEAPWARQGFVRTYEFIFWATKGQRGIHGPIPDILSFPKVHHASRNHAAEKPQALLSRLILAGSDPGGLVLDPTAGGGSTIEAATRSSRRSVGVEIDPDHYNAALARMNQVDQERAKTR